MMVIGVVRVLLWLFLDSVGVSLVLVLGDFMNIKCVGFELVVVGFYFSSLYRVCSWLFLMGVLRKVFWVWVVWNNWLSVVLLSMWDMKFLEKGIGVDW